MWHLCAPEESSILGCIISNARQTSGLSTAIGVVLKNIPLWMSIGMMIGICIGATIDYEKRKKPDNKNDEKME